jgi:hypothetical protein
MIYINSKKEELMPDAHLTIEIKNTQPVELLDLTSSFFSFADEFKRHMVGLNEPILPTDARFYIKEIKTGSIIADLISYAPSALPFMEHANNILGFAAYLKLAYDFLLSKEKKKPEGIQKINFENLYNIVEPTAKDTSSQFNIFPKINGNVKMTININNIEANAIQNKAKKEIEAMREPIAGTKEKTLLYWYQARNDPKSQCGDKAIIESINKRPVKVVWADENLKAKMLLDNENPFVSAYVVDVAIETIDSIPTLYKILKMYERIDR